MRTCGACGTAGQAETASFCFSCGSSLAAPGCRSCGSEVPPGARFCPSCGTPTDGAVEARVADVPAPQGTARKIASVLFGDLVGFTTLSESRDPEEVRELLTAYFDECRDVVSRYGGELEKFIGDAVMAVWGLPVTREDDAERAVRAGLELVERVTALGDRIGMPGLAMRVGITTAEVAVTLGATGQGMVAGDPVNTAARIQSTASPGEVWVDDTTRAFSSSAIAYDDAGSHAMKGKADPVPLWKVRAVVAGVGGDRRDDGLEAPLVARDRELRLVKEVFHRIQETHRPGMLVVDGEPGMGKSRLAWEFEKYVDGFEANVLWHSGRCLSYGEGVAYYALAEAVRGRISVLTGTEPDPDSARQLRRALDACVPAKDERDWLEPRIAALLGQSSGTSFAREDLFVAWTAFFKYVGLFGSDSAQPVVLVIDDAQYADAGLLAFLEHLLAAADYPVFVLTLARPELLADHPALAGNRRITVAHLEPLTTPEMSEMLDGLVPGLPEALRAELVTRAEGVPLYAIETVRSLVDQDLVVRRDGRFELTDPGAIDLAALTAPASLQALLAARLDTLPVEERRVVDRASVLGLVFTEQGITALCPDVPSLDDALAGLVRREVFRRETDRLSADFGSYRFVQGAVRQVAYGMLSRRDRKATHLTVAHAFEEELASRSDAYELAPIIAQHYLDAIDAVPGDDDVVELTRAACDHLERAAERAADLGAPREAAAHLARALERCEPERRLAVQSRLARQLRMSAQHEAAIEHATVALKGFDAAGDLIGAAAAAEDLSRSLVYSEGDLVRAEGVIRDVLDRLPAVPEDRKSLEARFELVVAMAPVQLRTGDREGLVRTAQESLPLAELLADPRRVADSWSLQALACTDSLPRLAALLFEQAAELAREHRALRVRAVALLNLTALKTFEDLADAARHGQQAVEDARAIGDDYMVAFSQSNLSLALLLAGDWEQARALSSLDHVREYLSYTADILLRFQAFAQGVDWPPVADAVEQSPEDIEDPGVLAERELDVALEAHGAGNPEAARLAVEAAGRVSDAASTSVDVWPSWLVASEIACEQRDRDAVVAALALVDRHHGPRLPSVRMQCLRLQALTGEGGSRSAADVEAAYREALAIARGWGSGVYEARVSADLGLWLLRQGRGPEAADLLTRARATYERLGARRWLEALDERVAGHPPGGPDRSGANSTPVV